VTIKLWMMAMCFAPVQSSKKGHALRAVARLRSLCGSFFSAWKHWILILRNHPIRASLARERGDDSFALPVIGTDLIRGAGHHRLGC